MLSIGYSVALPSVNKKFILTWPDLMTGCSILNMDNRTFEVNYYSL